MLENMQKREDLEILDPVRIDTLDDLIAMVESNAEKGLKDQKELAEMMRKCSSVEEGMDLMQQYSFFTSQQAVANSELNRIFIGQTQQAFVFEDRLNKIIRSKKPVSQKIEQLLELESDLDNANQSYPQEPFVFWTGGKDELDRLAYQRFAGIRIILSEPFPYGALYETLADLFQRNKDEENRVRMLEKRRMHEKGDAGVLIDLASYYLKKGRMAETWDALKDAYNIVWKASDVKKLWVLLFRYFEKTEQPKLALYSFFIADRLHGPLTRKEISDQRSKAIRMSLEEMEESSEKLMELLEANTDFLMNDRVFEMLYERVLLKDQLLGRSGGRAYETDANIRTIIPGRKEEEKMQIELGRRAQASIDCLLNTEMAPAIEHCIDMWFNAH